MNNTDRELTRKELIKLKAKELKEEFQIRGALWESYFESVIWEIEDAAPTPPTESVEGRIQPSDIGDILHTKYAHRKHNDEYGFTGYFNLSPREVLDVMIELGATYPAPESEPHPMRATGTEDYNEEYLTAPHTGSAPTSAPESEGVGDIADIREQIIEDLADIDDEAVYRLHRYEGALIRQARQEERERVIDKISRIEQDWEGAGDYRKADACEYLKSQLGGSDE